MDGACTEAEALVVRQPKRTDGIHVVYVGNMDDPTSSRQRNFHLELARVLAESQIHYHMYPSSVQLKREYDEPVQRLCEDPEVGQYVHLHYPVPGEKVVEERSQYHFGLHMLSTEVDRVPGNHPFYSQEMRHYSSANKIFDYVSAGLFTFVHVGRWTRKLVERYGFGERVLSFDDLVDKARERYTQRVPEIQKVLTTEHATERLVELYASLKWSLS